jgi:ATP-dependent Clp protease ATP-binding subunit ClpC
MPNYNLSGFYPFIIVLAVIIVYYVSKKFGSGNFFNKFKSSSTGTPFLDLYTTDFTHLAQIKKIDPVIGREDEVLKLSQVLSRRTKNNAILIGDPGVGKTAIVEGLAQRIVQGEVPRDLLNKRVLALDVTTLMSGTKYRGEFEERAKKIVHEISSSGRTIILFVDEVHSIVQSQGSEGALNLSDILKPALARGDLQMIGATTFVEYEKYIKPDASLERRFQRIEVSEPNEEETLKILKGIKDKYREYHKVEFTDSSLETAVKLTKEIVNDRKLPDTAIDAIDEAAAMVKVSHLHEVTTAILFQAAMDKHPEVANLWKQIQDADEKIRLKQGDKTSLTKEREDLEAQIVQQGIVVVDSDDIENVVNNWTKRS